MSEHATGSIESKSYNFQPIEEIGTQKLIRMNAIDLFHGDIEGEARAEFVAVLHADNSSSFVGIYRVSGTLKGLQGTFMLEVKGMGDSKGKSEGTWNVIPNSGTKNLAGLRGSGRFSYQSKGPSSLVLDYDL